jgi:branched-subunit amino acid transport protein
MSATWMVVLLVGAFTIALKAAGPVLLGGRELSQRLASAVEVLAPSVLAALVVTQAFAEDGKVVVDEKLVGVGVAVVAVCLRAPLIAVVVLAAVSTALVRWAF